MNIKEAGALDVREGDYTVVVVASGVTEVDIEVCGGSHDVWPGLGFQYLLVISSTCFQRMPALNTVRYPNPLLLGPWLC